MPIYLSTLALAYLLGSIPTGYLLVRAFHQQDIRAVGSGNIGATNVARSGSSSLGIATLLIDLGKGFAAVLIARHLAHSHALADPFQLMTLAAVAAILGHVYPVWLGFKGGKGVATAFGVFLALDARAALALLIIFAVIFAFTRIVSLSSIIGAAAFFYFGPHFAPVPLSRLTLAGLLFIPVLVIAKHHQNIRRLLQGTEPKFGTAKKVAA